MDCETIIETFFIMLGRFDFDRAKSYLDGRKKILQKLAPTFPNQVQLMTMLTTFSHLAEVEKNYHNQPFIQQAPTHSFLPTTSFLRKTKSLKDMYNDINTELQELEKMEGNNCKSKANGTEFFDSKVDANEIEEAIPVLPAVSTVSAPTTPIASSPLNIRELSEELISHFCVQIQAFIQSRLDLVDVYEKMTEASSKKFTSVDGIAFRLSMLCRQYHKYFHHPLLAPIKEGMTLECESLMTLIRATIDMQHWRFLPTLYDLQDAQSKLNYWAASTFNKEASKRRFKVSKTVAPPRLYEWLCKFKEFLVAKFTLYFHATLSKNFPITNFRNSCSKLSIDHYSKLTNFQRKVDALFIALMYDVSNEKDFRGLGYNFPSQDYQQPQGKNTLQPMVIIPSESCARLTSLQAEIYMIVMTNHQAMIKEGHYQFYDNIKRLTYALTIPDPNVVLVIVCDGQKPDRDAHLRAFSLKLTSQFAFLNNFSH